MRHVRDIDSTLPPPASEQALAPAPVHPPEEMREVKKENTLDSNLRLTIFLHYEHKIRLVHMVLHNGIVNTQNMFEKIDLTFKSQFSQSMSMHAGHAHCARPLPHKEIALVSAERLLVLTYT